MDTGFVNDWIRMSQSVNLNPGGQKEDLFLLYCSYVRSGLIDPPSTDSYVIVYNFYVNGEFAYRNDMTELELENTKDKAILFNEDIAILNFSC